MTGWTAVGPVAVLLIIGALAALGAAILGAAAVGALRSGVRRLGAHVEALRRHPLVGDLPDETDPALRAVTASLNRLLEELRAGAKDSARRSADLELLTGGPPDIALVGADSEWRVLTFGRGAVNLTGWASEEILDRHLEVLFAPGEWERILPKLARRSLREAGLSETVRLQRRDGRSLPAQVSFIAASGEGSAPSLLMAARDLTEQRAAEERLAASEARYRQLVEGMGDGAFIVQSERIVYANPAVARLVGVETGALAGVAFVDLVDAGDLLRALAILKGAQTGAETRGEFVCRLRARGRPGPEVRIAWTAGEIQGVRAVIGTVTDVTARSRFERALNESQARLKATLDASGDGILVLERGPSGAVVALVNPSFTRLFGCSADALLGVDEAELRRILLPRVAEPARLETFLQGPAAAAAARLEGLEIQAPARAVVDLIAGPVVAGGETIGTILTVRDETARIEGEQEVHRSVGELRAAKLELETACRNLSEAQSALAQRNEQLEGLNAELKSLDEMKSNLLANVSHELHTPLVSIKGYTEMILKRKLGPLTPEQERGMGVALKNIDRLIEMIDNLLSFSRMEKGETRLQLENLPLWQVIDEAIDMVGERIRKKGITVTTRYETDDLTVRGDRLKIGQVLTNLLTNAVKFNRDAGTITLTVRPGPGGFLEVEVADTGIGIPPESLDKIFERFYQVDAGPRRRYEGTGIGLSIVRDILRLHGCAIQVRSEVGAGSVFTFTLPLSREQAPGGSRPPAGRQRSRA